MDTIVAIVAVGVTVLLAGAAALWKLATMLAEVRGAVRSELKANGGGSIKDQTRLAADAAAIAALRTQELHDYIKQAVADGQREGAENMRRLGDRSAELEAALAAHASRVMEKHGEHEARLRQLGHDIRGVRATNDVLIHAIDLINQDRLRKEQEWTDLLRAQGLSVPVPRGIEHPLEPKSRLAMRGDDDDDGAAPPS